jgi:hypothetical protein
MALTLAACAGAGEPVPAAAPASPAPAAAQSPTPASPQRQAGPPQAASQVALVAPVAGVRGLMGMTRDALGARLGQAGFVRRDGPAEVWRYRATDCFLELFIYRDADSAQRVAHVDARNFAGRPASADTCLTRLVAEKRG